MPNERSIFCIQYFATLLLALQTFPNLASFWNTLLHSEPIEGVALAFLLYAAVTGGWYILQALACHAAKTVRDIIRWSRDPE